MEWGRFVPRHVNPRRQFVTFLWWYRKQLATLKFFWSFCVQYKPWLHPMSCLRVAWVRGERKSALLLHSRYSVSRAWKITSLLWFDFLQNRYRVHDSSFTYNVHNIVHYFSAVFHLIMTSRSVAIRVYLLVLFLFLC